MCKLFGLTTITQHLLQAIPTHAKTEEQDMDARLGA